MKIMRALVYRAFLAAVATALVGFVSYGPVRTDITSGTATDPLAAQVHQLKRGYGPCWDAGDPGDHPWPTHVIVVLDDPSTGRIAMLGHQQMATYYLTHLDSDVFVAFCP